MTDLYVKSKTTYKKQISFSKYIFSPLRGLDHSLLLTVCACFPTCVRAIHNSVRKFMRTALKSFEPPYETFLEELAQASRSVQQCYVNTIVLEKTDIRGHGDNSGNNNQLVIIKIIY